MMDGKALGQQILEAVKGYVARAKDELNGRLAQIEERIKTIPAGKDGNDGKDGADGKDGRNAFEVAVSLGFEGSVHEWQDSLQGKNGIDGKDGASVTLDEVRPIVETAVNAIPIPKDGTDGKDGRDGVDGRGVTPEEVLTVVDACVRGFPIPKDGRDGVDGTDGVDGKNGIDGKSITIEDVQPLLETAIRAIPVPRDGKDGRDGTDGKNVAVADLMPMFESALAKALLDIERRSADLIQRCIDRIEKPKDGKDGVDGLGFDNLDVAYDGIRTFTLKFAQGEHIKEFPFKVPALLEQGVYSGGRSYEKGDGVTFGGSYWIAQKDTALKPGENNSDWRLAVRKGRDGKDALR